MEVNGEDRGSRRTQAERTAATRAALIAAARTLFAEHGYAGVGTQAIVEAAGVTRGALYHQFGDKRGLFEAVFDAVEEETISGAAQAVLAAGDLDPVDTMLLAVDTFMEAIAAPGITRITMIDAPAVLGWEGWRARGEKYGLAVIEGLIGQAVEKGWMAPQPVRPLAHVILGMLDESALYVTRADDRDTALTEVRAVIAQFVRGLMRPE
ncbi:TetR/AcrR family transcriptional regulator [Tsukamurella ocularis]|uniref:TetR/AcrR family transcriptional regulator n=1 Tax=Tsukamurella ocularis TaxID=1970234 RepID=UPI0021682EE0|nr:TetR/AcrR family transcriptional regulator [Tsukamurella ocularis]MCS3778458.1 AcrR family transcriptional regulator [Tsukamurella ocularis]MCS3789159.1 AcrR family transcriptional regulator [Tsukamurella ocularis]MCS3853010.1 AcrR family transcriptional regulator [Tsukamurella ocularis]